MTIIAVLVFSLIPSFALGTVCYTGEDQLGMVVQG